ncbi:hypothetical protein CHGG_06573 [Chaetomium globosum CBS 148.51]|uniref:JmjC domain-containing protein n=1 Tax=Chaetomium globosum (strain ATCC 6205 / CBS 148.51 / DSM 1962 / NBRC 6347 / NRRL 1970) TaxID=306901 RepID=Q2H442_CHAGB|nr:uncharacterized protein CHGG_06573 [Chaetomium globosum CBS 148.51]EAQ89954.1 hypothetical protein CHGG_06573 [Chaetomium globosum CBS 148.51]
MDALQQKVDSISGEVSQISDALRGYLDHGITSGRKVQPPKTKAGRDLLQHFLGRLHQVNAGLDDVRKLAVPHVSSSPSAVHGLDTPPSSSSTLPASQHILSPSNQRPVGQQPSDQQKVGQQAADQQPDNEQPAGQQPECQTSQADQNHNTNDRSAIDRSSVPVPKAEPELALSPPIPAAPSATSQGCPLPRSPPCGITLSDGSVYKSPLPSGHASPLFDCTYQDIHILNEELLEMYSSHPTVRDVGYFKLQVRGLPPLDVQKVARPSKDHATSFSYKSDRLGLVKVDTGKRFKFTSPHLPLPMSAKMDWSLAEQKELWNSSAAEPPKGNRPYIIGNPLFQDVELSPGEKLRRRGRTVLEGINTQYVYFNLTGKTITTMHREDAHVRSENLLRSGQHKFWCFIKPAFAKKLEERMAIEYPEMRRCSQAVRHLSRHIPPAKLDEWGVEYTLDYCVPGQAVVTEPGTYHQVLNLGPNYAIAINLEYNSSPDMPPDYKFCDRLCPDKFAMSADDFRIYDEQPSVPAEQQLPRTPDTTGSQDGRPSQAIDHVANLRAEAALRPIQSATPPPESNAPAKQELAKQLPSQPIPETHKGPQSANTPSNSDEELPPSKSQSNVVQESQPPDSQFTSLSSISSEQSMPASPRAPEQLNMASQEGNRGGILSPPETKRPIPDAVTKSAQIIPQVPPLRLQSPSYRGDVRTGTEALTPLRKTARMINRDREDDGLVSRPLKKQRLESPVTPGTQDRSVTAAFEHLSTMLKDRESGRAGRLAAEKLCGKAAFDRLAQLVREWRRYSKLAPVVLGRFGLARSVEDTAHGYPELHLFLARFFKMKVAMCVEHAMAQPGELSPHNFMNGMLQTLGWDESRRPQLHDYLREGKCWATVCGDYDGLLCLMGADWDCMELALFKDEIARFHAELDIDFVRKLCGAGAVLQKSIWECLELPEFIWESTTTTWLPVDQISPLLVSFRLLKANHYDGHKRSHWPRPARWHWFWPTDPSVVMPGDAFCGLCPQNYCRCAEINVPQVPRILDDGSKGPGVRSVGHHKAHVILGELVGELLPLGTSAPGWSMVLCRPDLEDEAVAEIYPARMGNWVRKVNHSTNPSAAFKTMKITGRWRVMLIALRDINDGEEITAKYGNGYMKNQPYSLVEGLH